jgi:hypothetical protein
MIRVHLDDQHDQVGSMVGAGEEDLAHVDVAARVGGACVSAARVVGARVAGAPLREPRVFS